mmetsp:Transcript_8661/g.16400  ORF Transcript_8661/g.16400 Transcript_8661/m.16400 type:complete len:325 (+) Transcript_8661:118-1092(+)
MAVALEEVLKKCGQEKHLPALLACGIDDHSTLLDFSKQELLAATDGKIRIGEASKIVRAAAEFARAHVVEVPSVKWDDICGLEDVKRRLQERILYPVGHPQMFEKFALQPACGALFYGPPGCGKTFLATAVASECSANLINIRVPKLSLGESMAIVHEVFQQAKAAPPCVLFFNELDSLAPVRGGSPEVLNQLLTEIDEIFRCFPRKAVFLIGATDRPELLDDALLQPGRLDPLIYIPLPDLVARHGILEAALGKALVAPDVPLDYIAQKTDGFTGADLVGLCKTAANAAVRDAIASGQLKGANAVDDNIRVSEIGRRHFEEAF